MAELLGVVASAITVAEVAAKAGGAIPKLKALWDEIQNMENELNVYRASVINPILLNDGAMRKSTQYCRESLQSLSHLVDDMSVQIQNQKKLRRGLAKAKIVLKKHVLVDLEARLRKALALLSLAQQSYMMSIMKLQPHIIVSQLTAQSQRPEQVLLNAGSLMNDNCEAAEEVPDFVVHSDYGGSSHSIIKQEYNYSSWARRFGPVAVAWQLSERTFLGNHSTNYSLRVQLPSWLLKTSWEVQLSRGLGGPSIGLRAWRTVPAYSPAFEAVDSGDVKGLIGLLDTRQATLFDRDPDGYTLLHVGDTVYHMPAIISINNSQEAFRSSGLECVRLLEDSGLSVYETDNFDRTPLTALTYGEWNIPRTTQVKERISAWHGTFQSNNVLDGDDYDYWDGYSAMILKDCSDDTLENLLRHNNDAQNTILDSIHWPMFLFLQWPYRSAVPSSTYAFVSRNETILKYMLDDEIVGNLAYAIGDRSWPLSESEKADWGDILKAVLGDESFDQAWLHSTTVCWEEATDDRPFNMQWPWSDATPLVSLLQGYCIRHDLQRGKSKHAGLANALHFWLQLLQQNKVDLIDYGLKERQMIQQNRPEIGTYQAFSRTYGVPERLLDIRYGPNPQDWYLIWDLDVEQMAGQFWTSLREPEFAMPGGWVDD
ncbi:hypothetical protein PFICI_02928 [Pestalotiopsis fici W106-1]|uniref:Fungal N-terminal domain-containing protein n=1 Tax=Pestalotiopsis fici (strain W106-1 / CGMCC3.15140) TaxID=1229662 RepID=W3XFM4_PESFW|nr:uncharacterized protein PFICI_02928 [Pestalotiopsis fici W106-1]ETS84903.1 hypothetical protein PFICI_02928 [Pestalotiopsis fici W106-1]